VAVNLVDHSPWRNRSIAALLVAICSLSGVVAAPDATAGDSVVALLTQL
jgi:hypothetical protein